jgi:hypothetical protein
VYEPQKIPLVKHILQQGFSERDRFLFQETERKTTGAMN